MLVIAVEFCASDIIIMTTMIIMIIMIMMIMIMMIMMGMRLRDYRVHP